MAVDFEQLGIFKNVTGTGDKIINLQEDAGTFRLTVNGEFRQFNVFRGIRTDAEIAANRRVREALLKNLRAAFGLQKDADYMNKLKRILGDDILKSEDFGANAEGEVSTNCPLTERRISAISNRVRELATNSTSSAIARAAMTKKSVDEFVAGVKRGKFGTAEALTKFIARHFGGETGRRLEAAAVAAGKGRNAFYREVAVEMLAVLRPALIEGGVTQAQLQKVLDAMKSFSGTASSANALHAELALSFLTELTPVANDIAKESLGSRLARKTETLRNIDKSEMRGMFGDLMKSDHGRDIVVKKAIECLKALPTVNDKGIRQRINDLLRALAEEVKKLGPELANLFVNAICEQSSNKYGPSIMHMQQRQLLGTVLKQYTDLTDADIRQFSIDELKGYAGAAVDDSLATDREVILGEMRRYAESLRQLNYTDAETRELIEFAHELNEFKPVRTVRDDVEVVPDVESVENRTAIAQNKIICDALSLLGKLFHREDVWTADALGGAKAIHDTLQNNVELVKSLKENWSKNGLSIGTFSGGVTMALTMALGDGEKSFAGAIDDINRTILSYVEAGDENTQLKCCEEIAKRVDDLMTGLSRYLPEILNKNLGVVFNGAGFKDLPPGQKPETADLLELAKSHHPTPKYYETAAQRKEREVAILNEYSKLVASPQAGGLGTLIRSLATNYVGELDNREKRAMISGALQSITPELLTKVLNGKSVFGVAYELFLGKAKDALGNLFTPLLGNKKSENSIDLKSMIADLKAIIGIGKDGSLPEPVKEMAGVVAGGVLKSSGPVLQKVVQMIGAEKLPPYLQKAVKECKSDLKPIPEQYVQAKLAEVVRQSNGRIIQLSNPRSIGAASIAQAFVCDLRNRAGETRTVVVKIMRPDVRGRMEREIAAIKKSVSGLGEGAMRTLNARITSLLGELDFAEERSNIEQCRSIYGKSFFECLRSVELAEECPQLPDVLVMELAPGQTFQKYMDETTGKLDRLLDGRVKTDEKGHKQFTPMNPKECRRLESLLMATYQDVRKRQVNLQWLMQTWFSNALFGDGKFHGDLHGGNVMVDYKGRLTVIDFGNAPTFSFAERKHVVNLVVAAARGEAKPLLDAVSQLVSPEARKCLTKNFEVLQGRLEAAFAIGGADVIDKRFAIVFGELARLNVEVPESLYNFVEAFARVQQLSDSMTRTLDRIFSAIPYIRDHQPDGDLQFPVSQRDQLYRCGYAGGKSMDNLIDELLTERIELMRKDEPHVTDANIFRRLREEANDGGFDALFSSYRKDNPVVSSVMNYGSLCFSFVDVFLTATKSIADPLQAKDIDGYLCVEKREGDYEQFREAHDRVANCVAVMREIATGNIEKFFGPYCRRHPELRESIENLKKLVEARFTPEYAYICSNDDTIFDYEVTPEMLQKFANNPKKEEEIDAYIGKYLQKDLKAVNGKTQEQVKADIARISIAIRKILCTEIYPVVVDSFKSRMREVIDKFSEDKFPPPVSIKSSVSKSIMWHFPTAIYFGGTDMLGLAAKMIWKALTDKDVKIRANFNVPLDVFRDFASGSDGRIHMTEKKKLEAAASQDKPTVHNAEAWRALAESLMVDMNLDEGQFYQSTTWKKIAAIFEFVDGENFVNVEKAGELTPTTLQRILAVRDMEKMNRSQPSFEQIAMYFIPMVEDTTYELFNAKLTSAFQEEFGTSAAAKLGLKPEELDKFCKANYGKIIVRMTEIGAADPYGPMSGEIPRQQDVRRWLIAAVLETLKAESESPGRDDGKYTLEAVFGQKIGNIREKIANLKLFPANGKSDVITAILLHTDLNAANDKQDEVEMMLRFCRQESESILAKGQPIRGAIGSSQKQRDYAAKRDLYSKVKDPVWRGTFRSQVNELGFGMAQIAADKNLYDSFVAAKRKLDEKFTKDLTNRVRKSMYFLATGAELDEGNEMNKIYKFWSLKDDYEHPPKVEEDVKEEKDEDGLTGAAKKTAKNFLLGLIGLSDD